MTDIFLSYAREDAAVARKLAKALEDEGWSVWWDHRILVGKVFDEVIEKELAAARCVVVLWSKNSIKSKWVKIEARDGWGRGILIPAALIAVEMLPLGFRFEQTASLIGWKGEKAHQGYQSLINALSTLVGQPRRAPNRREPTLHPDRNRGAEPGLNHASNRSPGVMTSLLLAAFRQIKRPNAWEALAVFGKLKNVPVICAIIAVTGIFVLFSATPSTRRPPVPSSEAATVYIGSYNQNKNYDLYRDGHFWARTPHKFTANVGDIIDVECWSDGTPAKKLTPFSVLPLEQDNIFYC